MLSVIKNGCNTMVNSMTAFSLKEGAFEGHTLTWEIRTVNHRFLDISMTLPEAFKDQENTFRAAIQKTLKRGKVDARLRHTSLATHNQHIEINEQLARALIVACRQIESIADSTEPVKAVDILQWPGVTVDAKPDTDQLVAKAMMLLDITLKDLSENRQREGTKLAGLIDQRCDQIAELIMKVRRRRPEVIAAQRKKIQDTLAALKVAVDQNRLEQEFIIYAQRLDLDEELDRIMAHLDEVNLVLERNEPIGRRLDFLMQELNREANTLSAKSNDTATSQIAVDLKVLIEQMREQVQNIE